MAMLSNQDVRKLAMTFFRSEMTLPPFGLFSKIYPFWWAEASQSQKTARLQVTDIGLCSRVSVGVTIFSNT